MDEATIDASCRQLCSRMHPPIGFGRGTLFVRTDDMFTTRGENDLSTQFIFNEDPEQFRDNLARFLADKSPATEVRAQDGRHPEVMILQYGHCLTSN